MRPFLRWTARILGGLVALIVLVAGTVYAVSSRRMARRYEAPREHALVIPTDSASIAYGQRVATLRGCRECHGANLEGRVLLNDPAIGVLAPPNLTTGGGGRGSALDPSAFELAVRHGLRRDGSSLFVMPAQEFQGLTDDDVAALVAYTRSLPPANNVLPMNRLGPVGHALHLAGKLEPSPAARVDHARTHVVTLAMAETPEYGGYLAASCTGCHGPGFSGGANPEPGRPVVANITPDSATGIGAWTEAQFVTALRTAARPDGTTIDSTAMPISITRAMTDTELKAIYAFLRTVPPKAHGAR